MTGSPSKYIWVITAGEARPEHGKMDVELAATCDVIAKGITPGVTVRKNNRRVRQSTFARSRRIRVNRRDIGSCEKLAIASPPLPATHRRACWTPATVCHRERSRDDGLSPSLRRFWRSC